MVNRLFIRNSFLILGIVPDSPVLTPFSPLLRHGEQGILYKTTPFPRAANGALFDRSELI